MACLLMAMGLVVLLMHWQKMPVFGTALLVAVLTLIPGLQFAFGLIATAGNAWVCTAYLCGLLLALLGGTKWELMRPGQIADMLFLAIGVAAILSVGLQLHQWLLLGRLDIWSMGDGFGRPFANLGQPNQLGTLLIWGLLALLWAFLRRRIGPAVAIFAAVYLLFGLSLTASRTAWIAIGLIVAAAWIWRALWPARSLPAVVSVLGACFAMFTMGIGPLTQILLGGELDDFGHIARISGESRPAIWALFLDAALERPWFGYGWNQVGLAQLEVAVDRAPLHVFFSHSHNLLLDLVLWCGLPLGAGVGAWLIWWFFRNILAIATAEDLTLILFLVVVANHALLELPLHHAYFLLPVGLVMGAVDVRMRARAVLWVGPRAVFLLWCFALLLLTVIIRDYSRVEFEYQKLRFEWANVRTQPVEPPDVLMLTQWRDFIRLAKFDPPPGMSDSDLQWMRDTTALHPSPGFFQRLATALVLNHRPDEAVLWLRRLCQVGAPARCLAVKEAWARQGAADPRIAAVPWPQ